MNVCYPFSAICGEEKAKRALMLLCINPAIGSVLITGGRGSGKSILLRAVRDLLSGENASVEKKTAHPHHEKCVDIPIHCTEDRLLGGMSFEDVVRTGEKKLQRGLLSEANGGYVFLDQLNHFPDRLRHLLLRVQQDRTLTVERDGVRSVEAIRIALFAAMNPEEGDLTSTESDNIGICVLLEGDSGNPADRAEKMKRMLEYEENPVAFRGRYEASDRACKDRIVAARKILPDIEPREEDCERICSLISDAVCPGHRGELFLYETARAIAALEGRCNLSESDIVEAAEFTLPHRMQTPVLSVDDRFPQKERSRREERTESKESEPEEAEQRDEEEKGVEYRGNGAHDSGGTELYPENYDRYEETGEDKAQAEETQGAPIRIRRHVRIESPEVKKSESPGYGRRREFVSHLNRGREVGCRLPRRKVQDLSVLSTVRAAAMEHRPLHDLQCNPEFGSGSEVRCRTDGPILKIKPHHLREKKKETTGGARILFLVDGSGSMGAHRRMMLVKRVVLSILSDSYMYRDDVAVMVFKGSRSKLVLPFTRSVDRAKKCFEELRTGGRTPLFYGLGEALRFLKLDEIKNKNSMHQLVLVSDGKNNVLPEGTDQERCLEEIRRKLQKTAVKISVLDTEQGFMRMGLAKKISEKLGAHYFSIDKWKA